MINMNDYLSLVDNKKALNQKKTIDFVIEAYDEDEITEINIFHLIATMLLNRMNNNKNVKNYETVEIMFEKLFKLADEFNQIRLPAGTLKRIVDLINSYSVSDDYFLYLLQKYLMNEEIKKNEYKSSSPYINLAEDDKERIKETDYIYKRLLSVEYDEIKIDEHIRSYYDNLLDIFYKKYKSVIETFDNLNEPKGLKK